MSFLNVCILNTHAYDRHFMVPFSAPDKWMNTILRLSSKSCAATNPYLYESRNENKNTLSQEIPVSMLCNESFSGENHLETNIGGSGHMLGPNLCDFCDEFQFDLPGVRDMLLG